MELGTLASRTRQRIARLKNGKRKSSLRVGTKKKAKAQLTSYQSNKIIIMNVNLKDRRTFEENIHIRSTSRHNI